MLRKIPQLILFVLAWSAAPTEAGPYLFSFSGTAVPLTDNDALTGAFVEFAFIIDSDAIPDDHGVEGDIAWYSSSIQEPTFTVTGSDASDGAYLADGPFTMIVGAPDLFCGCTTVMISQSVDGLFQVPDTSGVAVFLLLEDPGFDALKSSDVPIDMTLDDFLFVDFNIYIPMDGFDPAYKVPGFEMTITPVPEPTSLLLLAFGGAAVLRRRRGGM